MKKLLCVLVVLLSVSAALMPTAFALSFSVDYGTMAVQPGETLSKDIRFIASDAIPAGDIVKITMVTSTDVSVFPFEVTTTDYSKTYTGGGTEFIYPFSMKCRNDAAAGYYTITFNITENGNNYSLPVIVQVKENTTTPPSNMPRITITAFSTSPDPVVAGEEITLSVTFTNNTSGVTAKNVKAQLSSDGTFTPVSGSSSMFLGNIGGSSSVRKSIILKVKADVAPGSYGITFSFTYDVDGVEGQLSDSETVSIPVIQVPKMQVSNPQMYPEEVYAGQDMNFMASINNTGRSILYNVNVIFEDAAGCIVGLEQYIGNIEPGQTKNIDVYLSAVMEGESQLVMTIMYEDQDGEIYTFTEYYSLYVMTRGDGGFVTWPENPEPTGGNYLWLIIVVILLLAAGGFVAFILINRRKKAEQSKQLDQQQIAQLEWEYNQQQNMVAAGVYTADDDLAKTTEIPIAEIEAGIAAAEEPEQAEMMEELPEQIEPTEEQPEKAEAMVTEEPEQTEAVTAETEKPKKTKSAAKPRKKAPAKNKAEVKDAVPQTGEEVNSKPETGQMSEDTKETEQSGETEDLTV